MNRTPRAIAFLSLLLLGGCELLDPSGASECPTSTDQTPTVPDPTDTGTPNGTTSTTSTTSTTTPTEAVALPGFWRGLCDSLIPGEEGLRWYLDLALDEDRSELDGLGRIDAVGKDIEVFELFEVRGVHQDGTLDLDFDLYFIPLGQETAAVATGAIEGDTLMLQVDLMDGADPIPYLDCTLTQR